MLENKRGTSEMRTQKRNMWISKEEKERHCSGKEKEKRER